MVSETGSNHIGMDLKESFFQIKILYSALIVGVLLFAGICLVIHNVFDIGNELHVLPEQAIYLIFLIAVTMLYLSSFLYKKRTALITQSFTLDDKLQYYRNAVILRAALIEIAALSVGIGYLLSGELLYLGAMIIPLAYFLQTFPKDEAMISTMDLTYAEQQELT